MKRKRKAVEDEDYFAYVDEEASRKRVGRAGWPATVPTLTESDVCWSYTSQDGRRDISEWLDHVFQPDVPGNVAHRERAAAALLDVITERLGRRPKCLFSFCEYAYKSGSPGLAWQAACWNAAMRQLGFDVKKSSCVDPGLPDAQES